MPLTRPRSLRNSREILDLLQCDDDSDIDEDMEGAENDILGIVTEMRVVTENIDDDGDNDEEFLEPRSTQQRGTRMRGRSSGRERSRGRGRGTPSSRGRSRSSLSNRSHREQDEATGWTYVTREVPPDQPVFQSTTGVNAPLDEKSSQYDCLQLFWTPNFWKLIKTETNRYAAHMKAQSLRRGQLRPGTMLSNWKPVTIGELKRFFSIIIHMTLVQKESFDSYWSTTSIIHTPFPARVMTRDRFRAIYSCLHLNDNSNYIARGEVNYDAFFKLRPYFDELCQLCQTYYFPNENLTIDEGTCAFRGRVHFRVFNKDKPDKYGVKIYMLCDSETGYVLRMIPYVGDSKTVDQILTSLLEPYLEKWHTVYMDRFFSNPTTFDVLWLQKTRAVGTVMLNRRGLPQEWRNQVLAVNEMAFCHRGNMTACKWKDKREVCFLTTKHAASWTEVEVKSKGGKIKRIKPDCVLDYNVNKVGVDLDDHYVSYYALHRKSMKWWKKMFFHLLARSMVNAYIIYFKTKSNMRRKSFAHFLTQVGEDIAVDGGIEEEKGSSTGSIVSFALSRLTGRHFMEKIPPSEKKQVRARVCKVCADIGKKETGKRRRKETIFYCPDCNVPLCNIPCFKLYHKKKDYTI